MGIISDGCVSGNLPSNTVFAVHYPGYPSSTERAVETLGGCEGILKLQCKYNARSMQSNKLELKFRPEDPYSHPAFGEVQPCNNFLLKISKRKNRIGQMAENSSSVSKCLVEGEIHQREGNPESIRTDQQLDEHPNGSSTAPSDKGELPEEIQEELCADIIAHVSQAYHFNGMVDYQHVVAIHADVARRKKRSWADIEPQLEKGGLLDPDQEDMMILVPPLFSIKDLPERVVLRPSGCLSSKKKQQGFVQHRWEMDIEQSLAIDFNIKVVPKKVYWEKHIPKDSEQWEWQMAVSTLFEERPIWVKSSVAERLLDKGIQVGDHLHLLRRLLFRVAYYFSNGPFHRFWIRKGYDPRKDPESRIYQRTDFRVHPSLRSYSDENRASSRRHRWEDICSFKVFPYKCQISLQLFELADDYIQKEIRKPPQLGTCTCATGWFSSDMLKILRLGVAVRFLSVYPKPGAESLLTAATKRFERPKMQIYTKDARAIEAAPQTGAADLVCNEDREELNEDLNDEESEEEEEEGNINEYDNGDEEMDKYDVFNLAGEDGNFAQQSFSYMDNESISKNYLQELFGSFPCRTTENPPSQGDVSDEEYQIYEHYSDADDDNY